MAVAHTDEIEVVEPMDPNALKATAVPPCLD